MFKLPTVKSAFCGSTLQQGSRTIAFIHLLFYGTLLIVTIAFDFQHETDPATVEKNNSMSLNSTNETESENEIDAYLMEQKLIDEGFLSLTSSYFDEMIFFIQIVFAISLLIGIQRRNLDLILSWVILQITNLLFSQTLVTVYFIAFFNRVLHNMTFYLFFEEITLGIIEGYFVIVLNSYIKELIAANNSDEALSPIVINSSSVDLRYPDDATDFENIS